MFAITLKQLWARKRRLAGTGLAVVLGVAFLAGTLVLSDTLRAGFDDLFTTANAGIDAVVRGEQRITSEIGGQSAQVDAALLDEVRAVEGVASVAPEIEGVAQVVGADGEPVGGQGPPTLGVNWIDDPRLSSFELVEGRAPSAPDEVVLDAETAATGGLDVGDTTVVRTPAPVEVTVVGLAGLAGGVSSGGASFTLFTAEGAREHLLGGADLVTRVLVAGDEGVGEEALVERIVPLLPTGTEAITGTQLTDELVSDIGRDFLDFLEAMLLVFAGIALLVAAFSIFNTFSITVAQRTQQSALLRTLGASRRQVLGSIVLEALVVGVLAAAIGLVAGIGLALGLEALMAQIGLSLDTGAPVIAGSTVVAAFVVGTLVTVVAGLVPAVRASRVAPLAALRDVAVDRSDTSAVRAILGVLSVTAGVVLMGLAAAGTAPILQLTGLGATAALVGVVVLGPVVARPAGAVLGAPLARLRGITGVLARENAVRNPRRTAATASALMVGVAVVTLFTVVAASVQATIEDEVTSSFGGDLVVSAGGFSGSGLSPELAAELNELDEVESALGLGLGAALIDGEEQVFSVADPARVADLLALDVSAGSFADLGAEAIALSADQASARGLEVGDTVEMRFLDGATQQVSIGAIFEAGAGDSVGTFIVPSAVWDPHAIQRADVQVLVALAEGVDLADGRAAVAAVAAEYGAPDVQGRDEYGEAVAGGLDQLLAVVYVLLALAIVIASMGIANALSLSIHERVREIGLLRAVGQTRRQLRSMVRWESVLVATFGTVGGLGLGTLLGWATMRAIEAEEGFGTFAAPLGPLAVVLALGALVGVLAAVRPARRAARIDVLTAIATE